jgi:hypothetical protein
VKLQQRVVRIPVFVAVPAGSQCAPCSRCGIPVYGLRVDVSAKVGKEAFVILPIETAVVGGRAPTSAAAGSGVEHVCPEAA